MKACFIFNPRSGFNALNPQLLERVREFVATRMPDAHLALTERPRHGTELAHKAVESGCDLVVAIGGDGTMNEVASALIGTRAILGLIPCGSGNGLGRHLGIHGSLEHIFETLLRGTPRLIDTGAVNGLPFFNVMGLGFDATVSSRFHRLERRGFRSYVTTSVSAFFGFKPDIYTVRYGENVLRSPAFLVAVANSDQYGNNCYIAPGARVDDGLLDLTLLPNIKLHTAAPLAVRLFTGKIDGGGHVHRLRAEKFTVERSAPGVVHTDGEPHELDTLLEVTVRPLSLRIMVPPAVPAVG